MKHKEKEDFTFKVMNSKLWGNYKWPDTHVIWFFKGQESDKTEKKFEEIMAQIYPFF